MIDTNTERRLWVMNDQGLYNWWKSTGLSMSEFIKQNKAEINAAIKRALGEK